MSTQVEGGAASSLWFFSRLRLSWGKAACAPVYATARYIDMQPTLPDEEVMPSWRIAAKKGLFPTTIGAGATTIELAHQVYVGTGGEAGIRTLGTAFDRTTV